MSPDRKMWWMLSALTFPILTAPSEASDPFEPGDNRLLIHGEVEAGRDLEGPAANPDRDRWHLYCEFGHSYEARVTHGIWENDQACGQVIACGTFARVNAADAVLNAGVSDFGTLQGQRVRWIYDIPSNLCHLRARGSTTFNTPAVGPGGTYTVQFVDTTYAISRWNNAGSQVTVLLIQNTTSEPLSGSVFFYGAGGNLLHAAPFTILAQGGHVIGTGGIPALVGQSGVATVAHSGGWGALSGKAVAVEPATGFTFDTPFTARPR